MPTRAAARWARISPVALDERTTELALRKVRRLTAEVKQAATELARKGIDPEPLLAAVQRELDQAAELMRPTSLYRE
jgi:hypothetical protein